RDQDPHAHDRRIGAAGEAYVFEILSGLNLPGFGKANWCSTIRHLLSGSTYYADLEAWIGRETADIVYTDRTGHLTQYLRNNCDGGFPEISSTRNFALAPLDYYLEVKTTTGQCGTRFYMSGKQYKRMEDMKLGRDDTQTSPKRVYVIMRVYDLMMPNIGLKVFADP
ncbi:hypothetical protein EK21DRAFT_12273, partial [Setomelanomma holmii]